MFIFQKSILNVSRACTPVITHQSHHSTRSGTLGINAKWKIELDKLNALSYKPNIRTEVSIFYRGGHAIQNHYDGNIE